MFTYPTPSTESARRDNYRSWPVPVPIDPDAMFQICCYLPCSKLHETRGNVSYCSDSCYMKAGHYND